MEGNGGPVLFINSGVLVEYHCTLPKFFKFVKVFLLKDLVLVGIESAVFNLCECLRRECQNGYGQKNSFHLLDYFSQR